MYFYSQLYPVIYFPQQSYCGDVCLSFSRISFELIFYFKLISCVNRNFIFPLCSVIWRYQQPNLSPNKIDFKILLLALNCKTTSSLLFHIFARIKSVPFNIYNVIIQADESNNRIEQIIVQQTETPARSLLLLVAESAPLIV